MIRWDEKTQGMNGEERDYFLNYLVERVVASERWDRLEELLLNIFFLEVKAEAGNTHGLADNLSLALLRMPRTDTQYKLYSLVEKALRRDIHFIRRHPASLFQHMWNTCSWHDGAKVDRGGGVPAKEQTIASCELACLMKTWRTARTESGRSRPWMRSLTPPSIPLTEHNHAIISGHTESVCGLSFSPDGKLMLSASHDRTARLWNCETLRMETFCNIPKGSVWSVGFLATNEPVYIVKLPAGDIAISSVRTRREVARLKGQPEAVECLAVSPYCTHIACGYHDGIVKVWRVSDRQELIEIRTKEVSRDLPESLLKQELLRLAGTIEQLFRSCHPSNRREHERDNATNGLLRNAAASKSVKKCKDILSKTMNYEKTEDFPQALLCLDELHYLVWATNHGVVHIYDMCHKRDVRTYVIPDAIAVLQMTYDGQTVFCGGFAGVWALSVNEQEILWRPNDGSMESVISMQLSRSGEYLVCGHRTGEVSIIDTHNGLVRGKQTLSTYANECVALSPDSLRVAVASEDTKIYIMKPPDLRANYAVQRAHKSQITCLAMSRDGARYLTGSMDGEMRLWKARSATEEAVVRGHEGVINDAMFLSGKKGILSWSDDRTIRLWDNALEELVLELTHPSLIYCVVKNEKQSLIISGCSDGEIYVWEMATGKLKNHFAAHQDGVHYVSLSEDGAWLASGGDDFCLRVWDMSSCSLDSMVAYNDDDGAFGAPQPRFLGESHRLACLFGDDTIRIYDLETQRQEACLEVGKPFKHFAIDEKGLLLVAECMDDCVMLWDMSTCNLIGQFQGSVWTDGDMWAIANGPKVFPWRAVRLGNEVCIKHIQTREEVAWVPQRVLSILPTQKIWVGIEGARICSYILENALKTSSVRGNRGAATVLGRSRF